MIPMATSDGTTVQMSAETWARVQARIAELEAALRDLLKHDDERFGWEGEPSKIEKGAAPSSKTKCALARLNLIDPQTLPIPANPPTPAATKPQQNQHPDSGTLSLHQGAPRFTDGTLCWDSMRRDLESFMLGLSMFQRWTTTQNPNKHAVWAGSSAVRARDF